MLKKSIQKAKKEMPKTEVVLGDERLITPSGLCMVGQALGKSNLTLQRTLHGNSFTSGMIGGGIVNDVIFQDADGTLPIRRGGKHNRNKGFDYGHGQRYFF